jgi:hypothetical protein
VVPLDAGGFRHRSGRIAGMAKAFVQERIRNAVTAARES